MSVGLTQALMTEGEARSCIARIQNHQQAFWFEIKTFHERRGWLALGYTSFRACVEKELGMSEQHAYRLLDSAELRRELDTHHVVSIGDAAEGQLRELKSLPSPVRVEVARQVDFSATSVRELRRIVQRAKAELSVKVAEQMTQQSVELHAVTTSPPPGVVLGVADAACLPLGDASVDLIVTSPPYGLDRIYGVGQTDTAADWPARMLVWLTECYRVARDCGRLAINVPLDTTLGGCRPTYAQTVAAAATVGWRYRSSVVWNEGNISKSVARGSVDSPSAPHVIAPVEMVALFSKGDWRRGPGEMAPDLTHDEWLEWTNGIWSIPGEGRAWEGHPAAFPEELPRRLMKLLSFPGDVVLDPFVGSGTTAIVAYRLGRRCFGYDLSADYIASATRRLASIVGTT